MEMRFIENNVNKRFPDPENNNKEQEKRNEEKFRQLTEEMEEGRMQKNG